MRLLRRRAVCLALVVGVAAAGCDDVSVLDKVGALRTETGDVTVLFGACPQETVERVELKLTDDNFDEIVRVVWDIEADGDGSTERTFTMGMVPPGFRELTKLAEPLASGDHLLVVITSNKRGTIPMSFAFDGLRNDDVLVPRSRYRSRAEFDDHARKGCDRG